MRRKNGRQGGRVTTITAKPLYWNITQAWIWHVDDITQNKLGLTNAACVCLNWDKECNTWRYLALGKHEEVKISGGEQNICYSLMMDDHHEHSCNLIFFLSNTYGIESGPHPDILFASAARRISSRRLMSHSDAHRFTSRVMLSCPCRF